MKLPNFLVVGAAKAGTTALFHFLRQHPEVYLPYNKEPHFFGYYLLSKEDRKAYTHPYRLDYSTKNFHEYGKLFENASEKAVGEMSTSYLVIYKRAIKYIKKHLANPKIIIILRNPLESCLSHYNMLAGGMNDPLSFEESFEDDARRVREKHWQQTSFARFLYYRQVKAYMDNFKTKIIMYEDYRNNPQKVFNEICDFLEISHFSPKLEEIHVTEYPNNIFWRIASSRVVVSVMDLVPANLRARIKRIFGPMLFSKEKPSMSPEMREKLRNYYRDDIENLSRLLGTDLSPWLA